MYLRDKTNMIFFFFFNFACECELQERLLFLCLVAGSCADICDFFPFCSHSVVWPVTLTLFYLVFLMATSVAAVSPAVDT